VPSSIVEDTASSNIRSMSERHVRESRAYNEVLASHEVPDYIVRSEAPEISSILTEASVC